MLPVTIRHLPDERFVVTDFGSDTLQFIYKALSFYRDLLGQDLAALQGEKDLADSLAADGQRSSKLQQEHKRIGRIIEWHDKKRQEQNDVPDYDLGLLSFDSVGIYKSVCALYLAHLRQQRNRLAERTNLSKYTLEDVDAHLARLQERLNKREFAAVTAVPLLVDELASPVAAIEQQSEAVDANLGIVATQQPRERLLGTIEILDPELRARCLDLFAEFRETGKHDRLDTVVGEASRILENRLRTVLGVTGETGDKLSSQAFTGTPPTLLVSAEFSEQQAVFHLFKGLFGHIRNPSHHRLLGPMNPDRALQILGMIDYAIHVLESATKQP